MRRQTAAPPPRPRADSPSAPGPPCASSVLPRRRGRTAEPPGEKARRVRENRTENSSFSISFPERSCKPMFENRFFFSARAGHRKAVPSGEGGRPAKRRPRNRRFRRRLSPPGNRRSAGPDAPPPRHVRPEPVGGYGGAAPYSRRLPACGCPERHEQNCRLRRLMHRSLQDLRRNTRRSMTKPHGAAFPPAGLCPMYSGEPHSTGVGRPSYQPA